MSDGDSKEGGAKTKLWVVEQMQHFHPDLTKRSYAFIKKVFTSKDDACQYACLKQIAAARDFKDRRDQLRPADPDAYDAYMKPFLSIAEKKTQFDSWKEMWTALDVGLDVDWKGLDAITYDVFPERTGRIRRPKDLGETLKSVYATFGAQK